MDGFSRLLVNVRLKILRPLQTLVKVMGSRLREIGWDEMTITISWNGLISYDSIGNMPGDNEETPSSSQCAEKMTCRSLPFESLWNADLGFSIWTMKMIRMNPKNLHCVHIQWNFHFYSFSLVISRWIYCDSRWTLSKAHCQNIRYFVSFRNIRIYQTWINSQVSLATIARSLLDSWLWKTVFFIPVLTANKY